MATKIFKGKSWTAVFGREFGALYVNTTGSVPAEVNKGAQELVKKGVPFEYATKVFKAQFKDLILNESEA